MKKFLKGLIFTIVILILLSLLGVVIYLTYVQSNSEVAKDYLVEKYEINKKELWAISFTEYVYEDITDCSSLWFKKCINQPDLVYKYTFKFKNNKDINVYEDKDGNLTDDYEENK